MARFTIDEFKKTAPEYSKFTYWFYRLPTREFEVYCIDGGTGVPLDTLEYDEIVDSRYADDFAKFITRPEGGVGSATKVETTSDKEYLYGEILIGTILIKEWKAGKNPDSIVEKAFKSLDWLYTTDFFEGPASSIYHESYSGGLLDHTLKVLISIYHLSPLSEFHTVPVESATLIALVHDWCKIGAYESYIRNVKNETTGQWEKVNSYRRKEEMLTCLGHGVSSLYLAKSFFNLTTGEALAIRWHMGEYNIAPNEMNELHQANRMYPEVYLIQFADRLACTQYI